jgi:hypothetical protein
MGSLVPPRRGWPCGFCRAPALVGAGGGPCPWCAAFLVFERCLFLEDAAVRAVDAARTSARLGAGPLGGYCADDAGAVFAGGDGCY